MLIAYTKLLNYLNKDLKSFSHSWDFQVLYMWVHHHNLFKSISTQLQPIHGFRMRGFPTRAVPSMRDLPTTQQFRQLSKIKTAATQTKRSSFLI